MHPTELIHDLPRVQRELSRPTMTLGALLALQIAFIVLTFVAPSPVIPVGILLTIIFGLGILAEPRVFLAGIAVTTFLIHSEIIGKAYILSFLGVNWYAMDWLLLFAALSFSVRSGNPGKIGGLRTAVTIPVFLFLMFLPVSAFVGIGLGNTVRDAFADVRPLFYYVSFFLVVAFVRKPRDVEVFFWIIVACGTLQAIVEIALSLTYTQMDLTTGQQLGFARITGMNEVIYPLLLVGCVAFFPFVCTVGKRAMLVFATTVAAIAVFLSYTRGSWLAGLAGIVVFGVLFVRFASGRGINHWKLVLILCILFAVVLVLGWLEVLPLNVIESRATVVSTDKIDISNLGRLVEWQTAYQMIVKHPFLGSGLGAVYRFNVPGRGALAQTYLHNSYLYIFSKMGALGFLLFISVHCAALGAFYRSLKWRQPGVDMGLAMAFGSMLIVLLVKSLTTWHLNTLENSIFVGAILGVLALMDRWTHQARVIH